MTREQGAAIARARRVANPGCYPTGGIALLRPLVEGGLIPADHPISVNAVSGYSGGGKSMIEAYEQGTAPPFQLYGLGFAHKHVPELQRYSGLTRRPIFVPSVGNFRQGMLVSVPLHLDALPGRPAAADLEAALRDWYAGQPLVQVVPGAATGAHRREDRAGGSQRHRPAGAAGVRLVRARAGGAGGAARQPRQGRLGGGGAESRADARARRLSRTGAGLVAQ